MTAYSRGRTTTENFLVSAPVLAGVHPAKLLYKVQMQKNPQNQQCYPICVARWARFEPVQYRVQGDFSYWNPGSIYQFSHISESKIAQAIVDTREAVAVKSFRDYDALTDVLQLRQAVDEFKSASQASYKLFNRFVNAHPSTDLKIGARMTPKSLAKSTSRALRKMGKAWLVYRYAVMPLIYSYQDIKKVVSRLDLITDRSSRVITAEAIDPGEVPDYHIRKEVSGSVTVRSTVACVYSSTTVAQMSRVAVNPLQTAWELIPYSFVIDWFVNVGDYITVHSTPEMATAVAACTSIRTSKVETYRLKYPYSQTVTGTWARCNASYNDVCWSGQIPPAPSLTVSENVDGILRTVTTESYHRYLFQRGAAVQPTFKPNLNWRRYVDSASLSHNHIKNLFRFFKSS